jgi:hypothetical protein
MIPLVKACIYALCSAVGCRLIYTIGIATRLRHPGTGYTSGRLQGRPSKRQLSPFSPPEYDVEWLMRTPRGICEPFHLPLLSSLVGSS